MSLPIAVSLWTTLILATSAAAQQLSRVDEAKGGAPLDPRSVDPYTKGVATALERAGYVGTGPFAITSRHGTAEVDALIGEGKMHWIETAHFRLGFDLPPLDLAGAERRLREKLAAEFRQLAERLPGVGETPRVLDPWLRAHLFAQRCEQTYAEFRRLTGYHDGDFPVKRRSLRMDDDWLGFGPHLGQEAKYVVLVFTESTDLRRYASEYLGTDDVRWPRRHDFGVGLPLAFFTALDFEGNLGDDTALHCHLAYSLIHNLCDGYRGYLFETPAWFKTGLAQAIARRIDPRHPSFDRPPDRRADGRLDVDWEARARSLVEHDGARSIAELGGWRDYADYRFHDYVLAWSRMEFLMSKGDVALARFLHRMKAPLWPDYGTRDWNMVLSQQDRAIREAFGFESLADLDAAWAKWVRSRPKAVARQGK